MKPLTYNREDDAYTFECPHCNLLVQVLRKELACKIFRHGELKAPLAPESDEPGNQSIVTRVFPSLLPKRLNQSKILNPHAPRELCDMLLQNNLILGCGKPFRICLETNSVQICDYI